MSKFSLLLSTSLLACFAAATPAFAQDDPAAAETPARHPQDDAAPASASPAQAARAPDGQTPVDGAALQDIIVTAERRFNTAQKTAAAISVRPGAENARNGDPPRGALRRTDKSAGPGYPSNGTLLSGDSCSVRIVHLFARCVHSVFAGLR